LCNVTMLTVTKANISSEAIAAYLSSFTFATLAEKEKIQQILNECHRVITKLII